MIGSAGAPAGGLDLKQLMAMIAAKQPYGGAGMVSPTGPLPSGGGAPLAAIPEAPTAPAPDLSAVTMTPVDTSAIAENRSFGGKIMDALKAPGVSGALLRSAGATLQGGLGAGIEAAGKYGEQQQAFNQQNEQFGLKQMLERDALAQRDRQAAWESGDRRYGIDTVANTSILNNTDDNRTLTDNNIRSNSQQATDAAGRLGLGYDNLALAGQRAQTAASATAAAQEKARIAQLVAVAQLKQNRARDLTAAAKVANERADRLVAAERGIVTTKTKTPDGKGVVTTKAPGLSSGTRAAAPASASPRRAGPVAGQTVVDGMVYVGGNPNTPQAWKPVG